MIVSTRSLRRCRSRSVCTSLDRLVRAAHPVPAPPALYRTSPPLRPLAMPRTARKPTPVARAVKPRTTTKSKATAKSATTPADFRLLDAYWRAANYLSVGQIYLLDNPLLRKPFEARAHQAAAARPLGHDARTQLHLRAPESRDRGAGPRRDLSRGARPRRSGARRQRVSRGHVHRALPRDHAGRGGHAAALQAVQLPRRHSESRRAGDARLDPRRRRARATCSRTRTARPSTIPISSSRRSSATARPRRDRSPTGWHGNKFLNPVRDGAVLPILHLNGYKIANPCYLARIPHEELTSVLRGHGLRARTSSRATIPRRCTSRWRRRSTPWSPRSSASSARRARTGFKRRPAWPMIVLRSPKGWTCPEVIDGKKCEDYWRAHQVPMGDMDKRRARAHPRSTG